MILGGWREKEEEEEEKEEVICCYNMTIWGSQRGGGAFWRKIDHLPNMYK